MLLYNVLYIFLFNIIMKLSLSYGYWNSIKSRRLYRSLSLYAYSENELLKREFEMKLYDQGYSNIIGSDEAGRGKHK